MRSGSQIDWKKVAQGALVIASEVLPAISLMSVSGFSSTKQGKKGQPQRFGREFVATMSGENPQDQSSHRRRSRSSRTVHGYFVPTRSPQEGQQLMDLLQETQIGGTPTHLKLPIS